jgi:hypothetical protein
MIALRSARRLTAIARSCTQTPAGGSSVPLSQRRTVRGVDAKSGSEVGPSRWGPNSASPTLACGRSRYGKSRWPHLSEMAIKAVLDGSLAREVERERNSGAGLEQLACQLDERHP